MATQSTDKMEKQRVNPAIVDWTSLIQFILNELPVPWSGGRASALKLVGCVFDTKFHAVQSDQRL